MSRVRKWVRVAVPAVILAGVLGAGQPAIAGSGGEEIALSDTRGDITYFCVYGWNQNYNYTSHCMGMSPGGFAVMYDWWWQGNVSIDLYSGSNKVWTLQELIYPNNSNCFYVWDADNGSTYGGC